MTDPAAPCAGTDPDILIVGAGPVGRGALANAEVAQELGPPALEKAHVAAVIENAAGVGIFEIDADGEAMNGQKTMSLAAATETGASNRDQTQV